MLFNSFPFLLLFLPTTLLVAKSIRGVRLLAWLTLSSLFFYIFVGEPWFVLPMLVTLTVDFFVAQRLERSVAGPRRNLLFVLSLCGNLGLLFYFKYARLILGTADDILMFAAGRHAVSPQVLGFLRIALPAGISFYTFQSLSYIIDVYRGVAHAETNFWRYASFIAFFPHLVAGPLTRHNQLIPQLDAVALDGVRSRWPEGVFLFVIGLFKKVVIADRVASYIDPVILDPNSMNAVVGWLALLGYTVQLYFDFSGYSDMAIGLGRLFGVELPRNFDSPLQSRNPRDFWNRWHITLGAWLRDYLFTPLSYVFLRRGWDTRLSLASALLITMFLGGLWHGASWSFAVFGVYHGLLLIVFHATKKRWGRMPPVLQVMLSFLLVVISFVIFRAPTFGQSLVWYGRLFGTNGVGLASLVAYKPLLVHLAAGFAIIFGLPNASAFSKFKVLPASAQVALGVLTILTLLFMSYSSSFLYFNF
jgi:alginate O-acetyltransferase complex protein AlgI